MLKLEVKGKSVLFLQFYVVVVFFFFCCFFFVFVFFFIFFISTCRQSIKQLAAFQ